MLHRFYVICFLLACIACVSMVMITVISSQYGLTSLEYTKIKWSEVRTRDTQEVARLQFTSPDDFLGIIFLPFKKTKVLPDVPVEVVIIDKKTHKIIHTHEYSAKSFSDKPYFPVGLPVVQDSKNKQYQVAVLSQSTNLSQIDFDSSQTINTIHLVDRNELNKNSIGSFIGSKVITSIQILGLWPYALIFTACTIFVFIVSVLIRLSLIGIKSLSFNTILLFIQVLTIAVLVLVPRKVPDGILLGWLILRIFSARALRYKPRNHYVYALIIFLSCSLPLVFIDLHRAENATSLVFLSIIIGVVQEMWHEFRIRPFFNFYVNKGKI